MSNSVETIVSGDGAEEPRVTSVTPRTLVGFLLGQRQAILDIAACPHTLALGAVLVLSAGFAREYDGEDLLHEPWHLLIPHAASLLTSFLLYALVRLIGIGRTTQLPVFFAGFPVFLGLYWMTAPLAWLYAIPFERWLTPGAATLWNLRLLGIVSVWRVALMIRVIRVVYGAGPLWRVCAAVLLFGDAVMLTAIQFVPVPVLQLMGGVRMTDSERILQGTTLLLQFAGFPLLLILLIATLIPSATPWLPIVARKRSRIHPSTRVIASLALLVWPFVLPLTQPEQQRRRTAEQMIEAGDLRGAVQYLSKHQPTDFPPHWSPPPHVAQPDPRPPVNDVMNVLLQETPADWVRAAFLEKFRNTLKRILQPYGYVSDEELSSALHILDRLSPAEWLPEEEWQPTDAVSFLRSISSDSERKLSEADKACLKRILSRLPPPAAGNDPPATVSPPADAQSSADLQSSVDAQPE